MQNGFYHRRMHRLRSRCYNKNRKVRVVAGILRRRRNVLLGQRSCGKWEFPGGKVESGESDSAALCRELREELGVSIRDTVPRSVCVHEGERFVVHMYEIDEWIGVPRGMEGQALHWRQLRSIAQMEQEECTPSTFLAVTTLTSR